MPWTYVSSELTSASAGAYPGATVGARYQIRLLIQDIQEARPLFQDEEIDWFQTIEANVYLAAASCCEALVARAGNVKLKRAADFNVEYDVEFYRGLAAWLRAKGMSTQAPYVGGISIADKLAQQMNPDAVPPRFFRGEFDNPGANQPAPGETTGPTTTQTP